jgi:hypothetical protein
VDLRSVESRFKLSAELSSVQSRFLIGANQIIVANETCRGHVAVWEVPAPHPRPDPHWNASGPPARSGRGDQQLSIGASHLDGEAGQVLPMPGIWH